MYAAQPKTESGRALSDALLALRRAENAQADRALHSTRLGTLDFTALRYLVQAQRDDRRMSPKDVIVMLNTSSATVTNVIERLVGRGYLVRVSHPTDRRAHFLVPTDAAIELVDSAYHDHHATIVSAIDTLTPADTEVAAKVIELIVGALDGIPVPPQGEGLRADNPSEAPHDA
nr:MarR family transcriptional regulator [Planctomonas sp. JC2975]